MNYRQRMIFLGLLDCIIISTCVIFAYLLRFDGNIYSEGFEAYSQYIPYVALINAVLFFLFSNIAKMYNRVWQYASTGELTSLWKATTLTEVSFFLLNKVFHLVVIPNSIYLLLWILIVHGVGGSRFAWRVFRDIFFKRSGPKQRNLLIIGAGDAGALVAKDLMHSPQSRFNPVGFIDDDMVKFRLQVMGLPVLGNRENIPSVVEEYQINDIAIAMPSAPMSEISAVIKKCRDTSACIKIIPSVIDLASGKSAVRLMRDVSVEDLLGRDPVEVDLSEITGYVTGKIVLVTGAGGSIGSELCRQISAFNPEQLLLLGHGENSIYEIEMEIRNNFPGSNCIPVIADIQDRARLEAVFDNYHPEVVFHAAAHKHVPLMEQNPAEAVKNNILGTKNVAECADKFYASRFVMVSTDKAVNPTSVMGTTKRVAEMFVQGLDRTSKTKFVAVRFGNVLGSRGSVIPLFTKQIKEGGPVTVTHPEMIRYFMTIPEAVQLIIQAGAFAKGGEIFILDMGNPVKIVDLARDLIRLSGFKPDNDIEIVFTGMRPGEKLYEEILTDEEGLAATKHNRICVGKPLEFSLDQLRHMISKLELVAASSDSINYAEEIKYLLHQVVPTYQGIPEKYKHFKAGKELELVLQELSEAERGVASASAN
jgi:FlaA1/EpsC-like NDP-sugar epimerase